MTLRMTTKNGSVYEIDPGKKLWKRVCGGTMPSDLMQGAFWQLPVLGESWVMVP